MVGRVVVGSGKAPWSVPVTSPPRKARAPAVPILMGRRPRHGRWRVGAVSPATASSGHDAPDAVEGERVMEERAEVVVVEEGGDPAPPGDQRRDRGWAGQYVNWFRESLPYIDVHRGQVMVVVITGEIASNERVLNGTLNDIHTLCSLGVRIIVVVGARPQMDALLEKEGGIRSPIVNGYRVTTQRALDAAMAASGAIRVEMEAKLSGRAAVSNLRRHTNTAGKRTASSSGQAWNLGTHVSSGNYVCARPRGVIQGVDYGSTGEVVSVDTASISDLLANDRIVLLTNLGYSSTGEVLNCSTYDVAACVASQMRASKLLCIVQRNSTLNDADETAALPEHLLLSPAGDWLGFMTLQEAEAMLTTELASIPAGTRVRGEDEVRLAIAAVKRGCHRAHFVDADLDGSILLELYTKDGVGTMICSDMYSGIRQATVSDIEGIGNLVQNLFVEGVLVKRTAEELERDISNFVVNEVDGQIIACAALLQHNPGYPVELACFAVRKGYRGGGRGDSLLEYMETLAVTKYRSKKIFLLTTRAADWFELRGFVPVRDEDVKNAGFPPSRKIDSARKSKAYVKEIEPGRNAIRRGVDLHAPQNGGAEENVRGC